MTTYSFQYRITRLNGESEQGAEYGFWKYEDMIANRADVLKRAAWTPCRWWQFWRWEDFPRRLHEVQ